MPPMTELIPQGKCWVTSLLKLPFMSLFAVFSESGDDSDDDDLEIGGVTQDYKCPVTLMPLVDPVTS